MKRRSRPKRWAAAVGAAQSALAEVVNAADRLRDSMESLREIQGEYGDWLDNLPDSLRGSELGQRLEAVGDLDLEDLETDADSLESRLADAEAAELPRGFGRD